MILKSNKIFKFIILAVFFIINLKCNKMVNANEDDDFKGCYDDNMNPYLLFSSKTSYKTIVPEELNIVKPPEGCTAKMLWMIVRHGVRWTVRMDEFYILYRVRDEILQNHKNKQNVGLCEKDIENLRNWVFPMSEEQENFIHENGLEESREVARRFRKKFPELLKPPYVPGKYLMKVSKTSTNKTLVSGQAFMEAMFPSNPLVQVYPALDDDLLVQIYTPCVSTMSKIVMREKLEDFYSSDTFQKVLWDVRKRLNLKSLLPKTLTTMYKMCRFDKAWEYTKTSPWCGVFTTADLKVLEYFQDYKYYVKSGYGSEEFSKNLGCPLVRDLIMRLKDVNEGKTETQSDALFYMGHSTTINTLLVGLGISKDAEELTPTSYEEHKDRKWRTSYNGPFGANFAAVFYKCENNGNRVIMYVNEKPVQIDGCNDLFCSFDKLYDIYKDYINSVTCSAVELCDTVINFWYYTICLVLVVGFIWVVKYLFRRIFNKRRGVVYKFMKLFKKEEKRHVV